MTPRRRPFVSPRSLGLAAIAATVALAFVAVGCPGSPPASSAASASSTIAGGAEDVALAGDAWCGRWSVTIPTTSSLAAARARALRPVIDGAFAELARQIDAKNPDSELASFHTPPEQQPRREAKPPPRGTVAQATALLVDKTLALAAATDGAYDPTRPAATATTTAAAARPTFRRVRVENGRLLEDGYDVVVDLDAVAAAAAADVVARVVAENGFAHARVVVAARCAREQGGPAPCPVWMEVDVHEGRARARATRTEEQIDPRTGAPAQTGPAACVVDAGDAVTAAALARACLVQGEADTKKAAASFGATVTAAAAPSPSSPSP